MKTVRTSPRWARAVFIALAGILTTALAGCGGSEAGTPGAGVSITHAFGETVLEETPTRIVALGNQWLDTVQAFGILPTGYIDNVAALARKTPAWEPESLRQARARNTEQVAALEPDLILAGPTQLMVLNDTEDGSGQLFSRLGMTIPRHIQDLPGSGGRVALSPERVGELSADLLIAGYSVGQDTAYRQLPGYGDLPVVRKDAVVFLDNADVGAINQPTVLSLPYILQKIEPALVNAAR